MLFGHPVGMRDSANAVLAFALRVAVWWITESLIPSGWTNKRTLTKSKGPNTNPIFFLSKG
jgi:hypothetical protein